jgi:hypothetical protein
MGRNKIKEPLVDEEIGILLKANGFNRTVADYNWESDPECDMVFESELSYPNNSEFSYNPELDPAVIEFEKWQDSLIPRPSQEVVRYWLSSYKSIEIEIQIDKTSSPKYCFEVWSYSDFGNWKEIKQEEWYLYRTRREAIEEAIKLALKNL